MKLQKQIEKCLFIWVDRAFLGCETSYYMLLSYTGTAYLLYVILRTVIPGIPVGKLFSTYHSLSYYYYSLGKERVYMSVAEDQNMKVLILL